MKESELNQKQRELYAITNWIITHSECTPTEVIEILSLQQENLKVIGTGQ